MKNQIGKLNKDNENLKEQLYNLIKDNENLKKENRVYKIFIFNLILLFILKYLITLNNN